MINCSNSSNYKFTAGYDVDVEQRASESTLLLYQHTNRNINLSDLRQM